MSSNSNESSTNDERSDDMFSMCGNHHFAEEEEEDEALPKLPKADRGLLDAVKRNDVEGVHHALRNGAKVNCYDYDFYATPLIDACYRGLDEIVRILLDAGADAHCWDWKDRPPIERACSEGHLSTVEILLNHDKDLLEMQCSCEMTPLLVAIREREFEIAHFLLDLGANVLATNDDESTTLMLACCPWPDLEIVQRLLAAGVPLEARDMEERTALFHAAISGRIAVVQKLMDEHNANMFAADNEGETPFDAAKDSNSADDINAFLIECYGNKLAQVHGQLALHAVLAAAEYSFATNVYKFLFHPPMNPLRIRLPLGLLTLQHFRTLLSTFDTELIHNRDESGKLPIHIACQNKAPVEVLSMLTEMDTATLQMADYTGALPLHLLFYSGPPTEYASVQYLVEHGGVGTLAARNREGALPLHALCGSTNPSLRTVQYMLQSFSGSVAAQTNAGQYPFMLAACKSSSASLSVAYTLVRTDPDLINSK